MSESFYVTTPIYYVNDVPHIGHAYTTIAADVAARYHRLCGHQTHFLTGTDEHGQKVMRAAEERGLDPRAWCDRIVPDWVALWKRLGISNDDFIRTTDERHETRAQAFWQELFERGDVYLGRYEGPYCVACEDFYKAKDLVDGACPIHGRPVETLSEENYFFRLSKYSDWLLGDYYARTPAPVAPAARLNEVASAVRLGLEDISFSRTSFSWGIPLPWDSKHVMYVWLEALLNYVTAIDYPDGEAFRTLWPGVNLIGKDILRQHAITWPAMCHAAGIEPPALVFAHGWLLVGGEKMSKCNLTGIHPDELVAVFGVDAVRYYFMRDIAFGQDGSFSWESLLARYNSELANGLGNLASRVLAMIASSFDGRVPDPGGHAGEAERGLEETAARAVDAYSDAMGRFAFHEALEAVDSVVRRANGYLVETSPWKLKDPPERGRLGAVLWSAAETLRIVALHLAPFMPEACARLWESLGVPEPLGAQRLPDAARWGGLAPGAATRRGAPLFPRVEP